MEHTLWAVLAGIFILALSVALLVALLDYCMGEEDMGENATARLTRAEAYLKEKVQEDKNVRTAHDDGKEGKAKVVDGENKAQ
jgi:hypothetical protein